MNRPTRTPDPNTRPTCHGCGSLAVAAVTTDRRVGQFLADLNGVAQWLTAVCEDCAVDLDEPGFILPADVQPATWLDMERAVPLLPVQSSIWPACRSDDDGWRSFQLGPFRIGVQVSHGICPTTGESSGVRYLTLAVSRDRWVAR